MFSRLIRKHKVTFDARTLYEGHHKITYRGIKAVKCPFDYVMYQMLIWELKPDLIIEIGTHRGGTALYLADLCALIGKGKVHTIDIEKDQSDLSLREHSRITCYTEGYQNYDVALAEGCDTVLVIEDGSHTYEDTMKAIEKFAPLVTPNSYLIVEDGIIDELGLRRAFNGGPLKAIDEFLRTTTDFVVDTRWCNMFGTNATFNVDGFLRRVR
jgi:cephalosporin hydroxylase